jgi:5-methylthioribose kinase
MLYQDVLLADQGRASGAERALRDRLHAIWCEMLGFAGIEMHRRILGLAHIAEFERIENPDLRAGCEARALDCGRQLIIERTRLRGSEDLGALVRSIAAQPFGAQ